MNDLPYFPWYPADAEMDENFKQMDFAGKGFYLSCLNYAWINEGLPKDPERRARAVNATRKIADKLWTQVSPCFYEDPMRSDKLINRRQEEERVEALKKIRSAQIAGRKSGEARRQRASNGRSTVVEEPLEGRCGSVPTHASDSDSVSSDLNTSTTENSSLRALAISVIRPPEVPDCGPVFNRLINAFMSAGVLLSEQDLIEAARGNMEYPGFIQYTPEDQLQMAEAAEALALTTSARFMGYPINFIGKGKWRRRGSDRVLPPPTADMTPAQRATAEAQRRFRESKLAKGTV